MKDLSRKNVLQKSNTTTVLLRITLLETLFESMISYNDRCKRELPRVSLSFSEKFFVMARFFTPLLTVEMRKSSR